MFVQNNALKIYKYSIKIIRNIIHNYPNSTYSNFYNPHARYILFQIFIYLRNNLIHFRLQVPTINESEITLAIDSSLLQVFIDTDYREDNETM